MEDLIEAAREVQDSLELTGLPFCFIGGLANLHWGEPRLTQDLDLTVLSGWGREEAVVDKLLSLIRPRFDDARDFALENRVLLLKSNGGIPIDLALGALPFEEAATARAQDILFADISLRICSAEDLVVMKAFANRPRDWSDIEGILLRQAGKLDTDYILKQLKALAPSKPDQPLMERIKELLEEDQ
ncbi:MAG: nucleotidyl transferase AbiEii/AbiGii toxin family protein [Verrucomicrobia bacterium]|nr:nucleotidyl transferase AbiEii/AbiGii toxin family protein [Verrucomicrobiota bacterium]